VANDAMRRELEESLTIFKTMLRQAEMVRESFPRLIAAIDEDRAKLDLRRADLVRQHDRAEADIMAYATKVEKAGRALEQLVNPTPRIRKGAVPVTLAQKRARIMRELASLDRDIAHEEAQR